MYRPRQKDRPKNNRWPTIETSRTIVTVLRRTFRCAIGIRYAIDMERGLYTLHNPPINC